ncbi:MAG: hypothetical protein M3N30_08555, partial [Bacteroidota bacterium]|nr:hypothetical protein [Bacteroidota bacterium]
MNKKFIHFFLCIFCWLPTLRAQEYYFKHYQVENGLSNNSVNCSMQDKKGFLWFGTINGLNRFDGYRFRIFRHNHEDTTSIGSNFIRCLYEDKKGFLWVGTNKGIYIYNTHTEKFRPFPISNLEEVSDIKEDKKGTIWLISNSNLFHYNTGTGKIIRYNLDSSGGTASSIAISRDNSIWVSTTTALLKKYNPSLDQFKTCAELKIPGNKEMVHIQKIYSLNNGNLLVGTLAQGVRLFEPGSQTFQDVINVNPDKTGIYPRDFVQISDDEYWIGTETGIYIYHSYDRSSARLKKEYDNSYSISDNVILTFCRDREGGLWIGTYFGGLNYYPKQFTTFNKYFPEYTKPSIVGNAVHEICKDDIGQLWVGTEDGGLNKIDLKKNLFTSYKPNGTSKSIAYHNIHGLLASGDSLWIGTFMHGLDLMNIKTGKIIRHYNAGP